MAATVRLWPRPFLHNLTRSGRERGGGYFECSKVTILRVMPLSAQFGMTRHGVVTTSRSPSTLKSRTCLVPTHSGFQATSTLVVHLSPSVV